MGMTIEERREYERISRIFPQRLQEAMDDKGWDIYTLAFQSDIHENTIRAYLNGRPPKVENVSILTRVLDESADYLLGIHDLEHVSRTIEYPSDEEVRVMVAIATENDAEKTPTFASIARFVGISKQRAGQLIRRLEAAGWVHCDQAGHRHPGGLKVEPRFHAWWSGRRA